MNISDVASLAIIGSLLSVVASFIKHYAGTSGTKAKILVMGISIVGGTVYYFARNTAYWETLLVIIGVINSFYTFVGQFIDSQIQKAIEPNQ